MKVKIIHEYIIEAENMEQAEKFSQIAKDAVEEWRLALFSQSNLKIIRFQPFLTTNMEE